MQKILAAILAVSILLTTLALPALAAPYSPPFDPEAQAVYLANLDSSMMIYEKNGQQKIEPGALAQMMTVILAIEMIPDLSVEIAMKPAIENQMSTEGRKYGSIRLGGLYSKERLPAENVIWAVMLQCANEAAMMLADHVGDGSTAYFVQLMNKRAKELGANETNFTNPTGLPDAESYTTAYDMYLIARHAMTLPAYMELLGTYTKNGGPTSRQETLNWVSTNKLMQKGGEHYNSYVTALKVGDSPVDGTSGAISIAKRNGYTYMLVVMGCKTPGAEKLVNRATAFVETNRLYNWAFETFRVKTLLEKGKNFQEIPLRLCWGKDFLRLMSAHNFTALIPDEIESSSVQYELTIPSHINAPVEKGALIGEVKLILSDKVIGRVGVVAAETVEASRALVFLDQVLGITYTYWFKFAVVTFVALFLLYVVYAIMKNRNRRRYAPDHVTKRKKL